MDEQKLNLGAGDWQKEGWTTYDKIQLGNTDRVVDFSKSYNLPMGVKKIYISHMLEHLAHSDAVRLARACWNALEPGGIIRIICPDYDKFEAAYRNKAWKTWYDLEAVRNEIEMEGESIASRFACMICRYKDGEYDGPPVITQDSLMEKHRTLTTDMFIKWVVDQAPDGVQFNNQNAFNERRLRKLLAGAGFSKSKILLSAAWSGTDPEMCHAEFTTRPTTSICMEAVK